MYHGVTSENSWPYRPYKILCMSISMSSCVAYNQATSRQYGFYLRLCSLTAHTATVSPLDPPASIYVMETQKSHQKPAATATPAHRTGSTTDGALSMGSKSPALQSVWHWHRDANATPRDWTVWGRGGEGRWEWDCGRGGLCRILEGRP